MNERMKEILAVCFTVLIAVSIVMVGFNMAGIKHATTGDGTKVTDDVWAAAHTWGSTEAVIFYWTDAPSAAMTDSDRTISLGYTPLDLTIYTSANARRVLLGLTLVTGTVGDASTIVLLGVRKNGTTPNWIPQVRVTQPSAYTGSVFYAEVIVGLDTDQKIEYIITSGNSWSISTSIHVLGYWE